MLAGVALFAGAAAGQPVIRQGGLVHTADGTHKLPAGGTGTLFGDFKPKDCLDRRTLVQGRWTLPTSVCDGEVRFNGVPVPTFYAGASQYTIQLPAATGAYDVTVVENRAASAPVHFDIVPKVGLTLASRL